MVDNVFSYSSYKECATRIISRCRSLILWVNHPHAEELERISQILDENPTISEMVLQGLAAKVKNRDTGAGGMTAEQVLRVAVIKQMEGFSYRELAFHITDSRSYRKF